MERLTLREADGCDYCKHAWMEGLDLKPCASGNIGVELTIGRVSKDLVSNTFGEALKDVGD